MLQDKVKLQMDAATYFDYSSAAPGAECFVDGDITLRCALVLRGDLSLYVQSKICSRCNI